MKNFTKAIKPAFIALLLGIITVNVNAQNNALDFDGTNDYVEIFYNPAYTPNIFSVQINVKVNSNNGLPQAIFNDGGISGGGYNGFALYVMPDDKFYIFYGNGGPSFLTLAGPAISYGTWTNIAGTYDGTTLRLYVNGTFFSSVVTPITVNPSLPIRLGAGNSEGSPTYFFGGQLDEMSMWKLTLSPAQVAYNATHILAGNEGNLVAYYNFNEGIGNGNNTAPPVNTLFDVTSNSLDGSLNNFALNGTSSNWVTSSLVLPVSLVNFSGTKKAGYNSLQWSTASEQNSSYFEVQRSTNGTDFSSIAKVNAAGNSSLVTNYQYNDDQISASSPVYYYRLKMVDIDGSAKYSSIIFIKNDISGGLSTVYPNPARNQITINVADQSLINTQVLMSDITGKVLQRISLNQTSTQVDITNYVKGVYILKFINGSSIKFVKE
jgi:hypothetical protein